LGLYDSAKGEIDVFIGIFAAIIIRVKKSPVNWIGSDVKPWRREVVTGYRGSVPVYDQMYSARFVRFIYGRLKGSWAKINAMK
jgi:hypothetical protein